MALPLSELLIYRIPRQKGKKAISFQDAVDTFSYIESDLFTRRQVAFLRFENGYAFVPFENASSKLFDTKGKVVFDFSDIEKVWFSPLCLQGRRIVCYYEQ